jgi:hypothetical protein
MTDDPERAQVLHELQLSILRRPQRLARTMNMRTFIDLLVAATKRVQRDRVTGDVYAAAAAERSEDEAAFTRASTRAAARRWKD